MLFCLTNVLYSEKYQICGKWVLSPLSQSKKKSRDRSLQLLTRGIHYRTRGIHITPALYKLYCNILNERLIKWESEPEILTDAQNDFRKGRSTVDHILSLTSIIEIRKLKRQSTYTAFIDFKKAYDAIDRTILLTKLNKLEIKGRMFGAISSLYDGVRCYVRVNV